jgi:hypothetical protein
MGEPGALSALVTQPGYPDRVSGAVECIARAPDPTTAHRLLIDCAAVLGVRNAIFASIERDRAQVGACRFMLACEPEGFCAPLDADRLRSDPWLAYAVDHASPIVASALPAAERGGHELLAPVQRQGFASALLVPAHSGPGPSRIGLLVLGCPQSGFFEGDGLPRFRIGARALATELDDWCQERLRRELLGRITPADLELAAA